MKNYIKSIIITLTVSTMTLILISCAANVQQTSPNSANNEVEKTVTYEEYTPVTPTESTQVNESSETSIANLLLSPNLVASYEKLISQVIESIKSLGSGEGCEGEQCGGGGCGGPSKKDKDDDNGGDGDKNENGNVSDIVPPKNDAVTSEQQSEN